MTGYSDPYIIMRVTTRTGKAEGDAKGKAVSLRTSVKKQILSPVWNEAFVFGDLSLAPVALTGTEDWGWEGGHTKELAAAPVSKAAVSLERATTLQFDLFDSDFGKSDDPLGQVTLPFSTLLGDEDAVMDGHVLRVDKTYRVRPCKGVSESQLGTVRLDIVLRFDEPLTPEGWTEAIDSTSGTSYYWHGKSGTATWEQPAAYATMAEDDGAAHTPAVGTPEVEGAGPILPGDKAHKPPRPAGAPPHATKEAPVVLVPVVEEVVEAVAEEVEEVEAATEVVAEEEEVLAETKPATTAASPKAAAASPKAVAASPKAVAASPKATTPVAATEEADESEKEEAPVEVSAAAADAAAGFSRKTKDVIVSGGNDAILSSLSSAAPGDRQAAFMKAMRLNADAKKAAEADALKVRERGALCVLCLYP
jgi:hypothetical protein